MCREETADHDILVNYDYANLIKKQQWIAHSQVVIVL